MVTDLGDLVPALYDVLEGESWGLHRSRTIFTLESEPEGERDDIVCVDLSGEGRMVTTPLDGSRVRFICTPAIRRRMLLKADAHAETEAEMLAWLGRLTAAWVARTDGFSCLASFVGLEGRTPSPTITKVGRHIVGEFVGTVHIDSPGV